MQGSRDRSIYGAVCGWFSGRYFGYFATRYWIRHDGSDFWVGVLLALLAGMSTGDPCCGTKVQKVRRYGLGDVRGDFVGIRATTVSGNMVSDMFVLGDATMLGRLHYDEVWSGFVSNDMCVLA